MKSLPIVACLVVLAAGVAVWLRIEEASTPAVEALALAPPPAWPYGDGPVPVAPPPPTASPVAAAQSCDALGFDAAATQNTATLSLADWPLFGRSGSGWETYLPLTAREIGSACPGTSAGFAKALAHWQSAQHLKSTGAMDAATFETLRALWLRRRPFVIASAHGVCPASPDEATLAQSEPSEAWGPPVRLRPGALQAWRALVAAARAEDPAIAADPHALRLISGYRSPLVEATRCLLPGACGGPERAHCSAHRTGLAIDLYLGAAPGMDPASTDDANRLWQSRTPAYRWLVANADRFGFVSYPFEPWHWEWTGEPV